MFKRFSRGSSSNTPTGTPSGKPGGSRFRLSASTKRMLIALRVVIALFMFASLTAPFWINWLWFGSMGYRSIILTNYVGVTLTFLAGGLLAAAIFITNVQLALAQYTRTRAGSRRPGRPVQQSAAISTPELHRRR